MSRIVRILLPLWLAAVASAGGVHPAAAAGPSFSSSTRLLLKGKDLPQRYRYRSSFTQYSVQDWDGNIHPVMQVDIRNGWLEAAQETLRDPRGRDAMLSIQLFRTARGAVNDFGQFFTNANPETRYVPGSTWLGGASISGYGDRGTIYRVSDDNSHCPQQITTGLSFVYGNGIFSVSTCTVPDGEVEARALARTLLTRARKVGR